MSNTLEQFAALGHTVHLVSIVQEEPEAILLQEAERFGKVSSLKLDTRNTLLRGIKSLFQSESTYISKHKNAVILKKIKHIAVDFEPDLVWAEHSNMAWYAIEISRTLKSLGKRCHSALRMHNMEYVIWQRYAESLGFGPMKWFISVQAARLRKDEKLLLDQIDFAFPITRIDLERAKNLSSNPKYKVKTSGVDKVFINYKCEERKRTSPSLVIATSYKWVHNINGLKWFIDNVMPLVSNRLPEVRLYLVGKDVPSELAKNEFVNEVGFVEDVKSELCKYDVYIAPLLVGGGIRIKILEAMALGLPVIATPVSAEGISAGENEGLYISDIPKEQAETIIRLFQSTELRIQAGMKARHYISENHDWTKIVSESMQFITETESLNS
jgi:glycosyltransferase involved in cell wall biosynthesis